MKEVLQNLQIMLIIFFLKYFTINASNQSHSSNHSSEGIDGVLLNIEVNQSTTQSSVPMKENFHFGWNEAFISNQTSSTSTSLEFDSTIDPKSDFIFEDRALVITEQMPSDNGSSSENSTTFSTTETIEYLSQNGSGHEFAESQDSNLFSKFSPLSVLISNQTNNETIEGNNKTSSYSSTSNRAISCIALYTVFMINFCQFYF